MKIAVEEINANGGINGMNVVLDFQDSAADPDSAVAAYGKLMDNGMNIFTGGVLSLLLTTLLLLFFPNLPAPAAPLLPWDPVH